MTKPKKVVVNTVCSECGLAWDSHEEKTLEECVRLLKAELAKRPLTSWSWSNIQPRSYPYSYTESLDCTGSTLS